MFDLPGPLGTFADFLVILVGFGFIIFIHELGHFLAAKWAGIRVLAFSIGFGQVVCSYRKGVGVRRGSSEHEYRKRVKGLGAGELERVHEQISPTEYRLSLLPLGGYVKMLGQEDLNPDAVSGEPDSYQNCPVGKRMVVISAGVIMNVISAAVLFVIVFMAGLKVFPAKAGFVEPDGPAAMAEPLNPEQIGSDAAGGIGRGDRILEINGKRMYSFEHVLPEIAMSRSGQRLPVLVERPGVEEPIAFAVTPVKSDATGLLDIGISPPISTTLKQPRDEETLRQFEMFARQIGLGQLEPGDRFISVNGEAIASPHDLLDAAEASGGEPLVAQIERGGERIEITLEPIPELQTGFTRAGAVEQVLRHALGLTGVLMVQPTAAPEDTAQGLMPGDIFARVGTSEFPTLTEGIAAVRSASGGELDVVVLRPSARGELERVRLRVEVDGLGRIGFYPGTTTGLTNLVAEPVRMTPLEVIEENPDAELSLTAAMELIEYPGSRIVSLEGEAIGTLRDVPGAIMNAVGEGYREGQEAFAVGVTLELPLPRQPDGTVPTVEIDWQLTRAEIDRIAELGWTLAGRQELLMLFEFEQVIDKSNGPFAAVKRGVAESRRVMLQTYLTFLRLFEGSVGVEHLKGPVGIAHLGTQVASQGWVWVLFFMALISINLAVINFLPLPIVDGGQFLMLVYEWIRGRPVPIVVQNVATMAGLLLIGMVFLYVTFNDVKAIFGA